MVEWLPASRSKQENNILLHQVLVVAHPSGATCGTWTEGDKLPNGPTQVVQAQNTNHANLNITWLCKVETRGW
jgi:hypothetical protein